MVDEAILEAARRFRDHDPDPDTRAELTSLIDAESDELRERFAGPLSFGTAGLRGLLGAGETRMNRAVVRRTTAGLAHYLKSHVEDAAPRGVVIGFDGRRQSDVFAADAAAVLCAAGIRVYLAEILGPTPLLAYGVLDLGAAAGIMVTASHNPPDYNGYKVYAGNGAQIIPPTDRLIAEGIDAAPPADAVPLADLDAAREEGRLEMWGEALERRYLDAIGALVESRPRSMPIVYTPLHGVGARTLEAAFADAGFTGLVTVPEQREPDGRFPTVAFPNPEEDGAMDLSIAAAEAHGAPLVIANDPDADRLAVVVRHDGAMHQLTGNEVGVLLGHEALRRDAQEGALVVQSIVSSPLLGRVAASQGASWIETLTGFKWITNVAMEREGDLGERFVFGYEEALGYTVGTTVRDKDGISAALVLADLAEHLHQKGETLIDELTRIWREHGYFASHQHAIVLPGQDGQRRIETSLARLREEPPRAFAGHAVTSTIDVLAGTCTTATGTERIGLPRSNVLVFELDGGHRVIARPSGTEPKMKLYFDVHADFEGDLVATRARAQVTIDALEADLLTRLG